MSESTTSSNRWLLAAAAASGLAIAIATLGCGCRNTTVDPAPAPEGDGTQPIAANAPTGGPSVGGLPLFHDWPKDRKPDAAIVLSGQTFGFFQPCGCSRPQLGGLERRANFLNGLKAKGWPIAGADLGDLYAIKSKVEDQAKLKYRMAMNALREMGYVAVGIGKNEIEAQIDSVYAEYALQKEQPPFLLAGNLMGRVNGQPQPREQRFPSGPTRPMIGLAEIEMVGKVPVAFVGIIGPSQAKELEKIDPSITVGKYETVLKQACEALAADKRKPQLYVLLFQGTSEEAKTLAQNWPKFQVILCQSEDAAPQFPEYVTLKNPPGQKTMVIQVAHKGQYVGMVGAFKNAAGGLDLKYQLVPMTEDFITPGNEEEARKANPVLSLFDSYAKEVRDRKFLEKMPKQPHTAQIQQPKLNLTYIGSEKCAACHAAEYAKWKDSHHSHALDTLTEKPKRPSLRNFDGECVVCHTVGLSYRTGFVNEKETPHLKHVGCESCHGPGSGHAEQPKSPALLARMAPWRMNPGDRLVPVAKMREIAAKPLQDRGQIPLKPKEQRLINMVGAMCRDCHDHDNDPHFDLYTYWPNINHTWPKEKE